MVLLGFYLQSHKICFIIVLASFLSVIKLNTLTCMCFVLLRTYIFGYKILKLPVHLSRLTMNGYYLSTTGFKSIKSRLTMHVSSFKDRHFVAKELLLQ